MRGYVSDKGITWPVLVDPQGSAALDYGTTGQPETYVVAPDGVSQLYETHFLFDDMGANIGILTGGPLVPTEGPKRSLPVK